MAPKANVSLNIKITSDEYEYAKALSKRIDGCARPNVGSVAYGFKWCLRKNAKEEGKDLD